MPGEYHRHFGWMKDPAHGSLEFNKKDSEFDVNATFPDGRTFSFQMYRYDDLFDGMWYVYLYYDEAAPQLDALWKFYHGLDASTPGKPGIFLFADEGEHDFHDACLAYLDWLTPQLNLNPNESGD